MPTFPTTTKSANQIWASPDGQRVIYEVTLDYNGQPVKAKTYSKAIAEVGFSGDVEVYEKPGRNGVEQFVKQVQKEGFTPRPQGSPQSSTGQSSSKGFSADPFTMYLSYAKDVMVALIAKDGITSTFDETMDTILVGAYQLYDGRPDAPVKEKPEPKQALDEVFDVEDTQLLTEEDMPWPPSK